METNVTCTLGWKIKYLKQHYSHRGEESLQEEQHWRPGLESRPSQSVHPIRKPGNAGRFTKTLRLKNLYYIPECHRLNGVPCWKRSSSKLQRGHNENYIYFYLVSFIEMILQTETLHNINWKIWYPYERLPIGSGAFWENHCVRPAWAICPPEERQVF